MESEERPSIAAVRPMKAVSGDLPPEDGSWWFEVKWDGMRVIAAVESDGSVLLRSARGADVTASYPELESVADAVGGRPCVLDGEVVALGPDGTPSFARLQQRMHVSDRRSAVDRAQQVPVVFMVFDLLELDGAPVWERPYVERRDLLQGLVTPGPSVQVPGAFLAGGDLLDATRRQGLEGVVAKRADSRYEPGGRSTAWRKVKVRNTQEFVVGGWLGGTGARDGSIGSLVLGCRRAGELVWVGNVGTGFTDRELARLAALLAPLASDACPFRDRPPPPTGGRARWVQPQVVVQVAFGEWTEAGRLRHPSYLGQRDDKWADDVTCDP